MDSAWISAPGWRSRPVTAVASTSCSEGAVAPTTTILSRKKPGGVRPLTAREKDTERIVPGGPCQSIQASLPPSSERVIFRPATVSAVTIERLFSLSSSYGRRRITPPESVT
jgi:hypothetical protein